MTTWAWGPHDDSAFDGPYDSKEDAIDAAHSSDGEYGEPFETVYVGECTHYKMSDLISADRLLEEAVDFAVVNMWQEHTWNPQPTSEAERELGELLNAWAAKHGLDPKLFTVDNVEEVKL